MNLQSAIHFLYPPQCLACGAETAADFALCGECWRDTSFISELVCDACGQPLPGDDPGEIVHCDNCIIAPRPWKRGRSTLIYDGTARRLVLALKHGDRQDLVAPLAKWMVPSAREMCGGTTLIAPVPLHSRRLFSRRFNQAALLATGIARALDLTVCPDLLRRHKATKLQEGMNRQERFENQRSAFEIRQNRQIRMQGKPVLLIDDVLTSGATLSGCAEACLAAGATEVNVLALARVARDT